MKRNDVVSLKINDSAVIHLRKSKIMATIFYDKQNKTEIYLSGQNEPFIVYDVSKTLLDKIWEDVE